MRHGAGGPGGFAVAAMVLGLASPARADAFETQQRAIDMIIATADRICNVVSLRGDAGASEIKGAVKAQLSGLAAKLVDVGVTGGASLNNTQYQNVLQQDLSATLQNNATCKLKVFETLQAKLLGDPVAAGRAAPLAPTGPITATVAGHWRDLLYGTDFQIEQDANQLRVTGVHPDLESTSTGTISGRRLQTTYVTHFKNGTSATGACIGMVAEDGQSIIVTCDDSKTGRWGSMFVR